MTQLELILLQINYYLFKYTPVTVSLIIYIYICTYIHTILTSLKQIYMVFLQHHHTLS